MGDYMDAELKRTIILDHYQNPRHKGLIHEDGYLTQNMNNESCIDEVDLMVKIENGIIQDIRFDGEACAISTSATSIMVETLIGKNVEEAKKIIQNYYAMLEEKEYDKEKLEQAIVYQDIGKQPNRKKCALLSWWGIEKILEKVEEER